MVKRSLRRSALSVLAVAVSAALAAQPATPKKSRPTLDQQTARFEKVVAPDGSVLYKRSFKHAIPWEEYVAALAAETTTTTSMLVPVDEPVAGGGAGAGISSALTTCTPPDSDYDGDTFIGSGDQFPLRHGEYVADRPKIVARFTSHIDPGVTVHYNLTNITKNETTIFHETDLKEVTSVKETREFKKKFNGSFGLKLALITGKAPVISMDLGLGGEVERSQTYTWTNEKTRTTEDKYTDIRNQQTLTTVTIGPDAGYVSGELSLFNLSDYAIDVNVSNVRVAVVTYSPFTGAKFAIGDQPMPGPYPLHWGAGNNFATDFVSLTGLNSAEMLDRLAEGWVFDMQIAGGYTATEMSTGRDVGAIISQVNQRNSRISIHYGDTTVRAYGQVSVFQPANACLTGKDLLATYVGAANVEFDRMPDGTLIVKRINHRTNNFADRDFDSLTPAEQAQYGRWVVGFNYYSQAITTFDFENTLLAPEDKIFFYFLTAQDFQEPLPPPDKDPAISVANDGTQPATQLVSSVSTDDTVDLYVKTAFQIESAYTQFQGNINSARCGIIYGATWYGHQVTTDSRYQNITIPNADWYGLQVDFGGQGYRTIASLLADPAAKASLTSFRGFPDYDFVLHTLVTPAMLGGYPTRNLQVRSANARQNFLVGYEGTRVGGGHVSCRWNDPGGFYHNTGDLKVWYKLDNVDGDLDRFYSAAKTGIDTDDVNARRFPYAPEMLDGVDNNENGQVDESPLLCPEGLKSYDSGTCTLDNRTGWYPASPNTLLEQRFKHSDNTYTAWTTIGSGLTSYTFVMTSDPTITSMEIRTTYYPAGGGTFIGITVINHIPGGDVPLFPVGVDVEAESGRLVVPMRADTSGLDTYVSVPVGTYAFAPASADYRFTVVQAGDYVIWSRVYASSSTDDSFIVMVFDPQGQPINFGYGTSAQFRFEAANPTYSYGAFGWTRVGHWNPYVSPEEFMNPIFYHLVPGTYMVSFKPRELGARLDKLRLERYCPDNDNDGVTTCAGDCNDNNPNVRPGHAEVCSNGIDDDCDGYVDEGCGGGGGSPIFKKVVE